MLVRFPRQVSAIGQTFTQSNFRQTALTGRTSGIATGVIDGEPRLVAHHSLPHYPVQVVATTTVTDALENWNRSAATMAAAALLIGLVIGGALFLAVWLGDVPPVVENRRASVTGLGRYAALASAST